MAVGAYFALFNRSRKYIYSWVALFLVYAVAVRSRVPANDMVNYVAAFGMWPPPVTVYTVREPVIWFGLPLMRFVVKDATFAFVVIDLVTCIATIAALRRLDDGSGRVLSIAPTLIASFVYLFGQQNVLRQHIALVIFLWAISYCVNSNGRATLFFVLSSLAHNGTVMLFGHWLDHRAKGRFQLGWLVTVLGVTILPWAIGLVGKSSSATGANSTVAYVGFWFGTGLAVLYSGVGRMVFRAPFSSWRNYMAVVPTMFILGEAQFERISMMFLVLIVVSLCRHYRTFRIRWKVLVNVVYFALIVPVFLFPAALDMLIS